DRIYAVGPQGWSARPSRANGLAASARRERRPVRDCRHAEATEAQAARPVSTQTTLSPHAAARSGTRRRMNPICCCSMHLATSRASGTRSSTRPPCLEIVQQGPAVHGRKWCHGDDEEAQIEAGQERNEVAVGSLTDISRA